MNLERAREFLRHKGLVAARDVPDDLMTACVALADAGEARMFDRWDSDSTNRNYFELRDPSGFTSTDRAALMREVKRSGEPLRGPVRRSDGSVGEPTRAWIEDECVETDDGHAGRVRVVDAGSIKVQRRCEPELADDRPAKLVRGQEGVIIRMRQSSHAQL